MGGEGNIDYKKWEQKRKVTTMIFALECLFLGMEYSVTFLTLWLYLKTLVKPDIPKLFYSLISACYLFSSMVFSLIAGKLTDRYRNVRLMFFVGNTTVIVGNIMYALPFSPWLLVAGRLISGGGGSLRAIISGEIARCYPCKEVNSKLSATAMGFALGFIVGPGINFVFSKTDFWIYSWHITYVNMPGIYMAVLFVMIQIVCVFMLSDLSKEYDLKEEMSNKMTDTGNDISMDTTDIDNENATDDEPLLEISKVMLPSTKSVLKALFSSLDTTLLLGVSFFSMYFIVTFELWLPLLVVDIMHWGINGMNAIILGSGISSSVCLLVLTCNKFTHQQIYFIAVLSFLSYSIMEAVFLTLRYYHKNMAIDVVLWIVYAISMAVMIIAEEIFLITTLAKMVSSNMQTFAEGIRLAFSGLGAVTALLSSAMVFDWIGIVSFVHIGISLTIVALVMIRKPYLANPQLSVSFELSDC